MYGYVYLNGRFLSVDPLAEKFAGWSAYHYSANNPINITDPSGMDWSETNIDLARRFGAFGDNCPTCPKDGNYQSEIDSYFDYTYDKTTGKATKNEITKKDLPEVTIVGGRTGSSGKSGGISVGLQNTQTALAAFDFGHGAKEELINYAAKSSPGINELKYVKAVKIVSKGLFAAQAGISLYQAGKAFQTSNDNKWGVAGKASLDITIGAISVWGGPVGWAVGGVYFIGDASGLWGNWGNTEPNSPIDKNKK